MITLNKAIKCTIGGVASYAASKILAPYAWDSAKSYMYGGAQIVGSALKTTAVAAGALAFATAGCTAAYWVHKKTDAINGDAFELSIKGWSDNSIKNLHTYVPPLIATASISLAYLGIRLL